MGGTGDEGNNIAKRCYFGDDDGSVRGVKNDIDKSHTGTGDSCSHCLRRAQKWPLEDMGEA